jgi:hypothetical protein
MLAEISGRAGCVFEPPRAVPREHAVIYVLDGRVTIATGTQDVLSVSAGSLVFLPRDCQHELRVDSARLAFMHVTAPGTYERLLPLRTVPARAVRVPAYDAESPRAIALAMLRASCVVQPNSAA